LKIAACAAYKAKINDQLLFLCCTQSNGHQRSFLFLVQR